MQMLASTVKNRSLPKKKKKRLGCHEFMSLHQLSNLFLSGSSCAMISYETRRHLLRLPGLAGMFQYLLVAGLIRPELENPSLAP